MKARDTYHHGDLRLSLLKAAEEELGEKGVEGFTLRGCAKRAGVSHAAPAHHFGDANGLLTALAASGFERLTITMAEREEEAGTDARERFVGMGLGYIDFALANPAVFQMMFSSKRPQFNHQELENSARAAFMMLVQGVSLVRDRKTLEDPAVRIDVATAWSVVHGIANLLIDGRLKFLAEDLTRSDDERTAILSDMIDRALR